MATPNHKYKLNKKTLAKIEHLLPRLKYSVFPLKLINWLENFKEEEVDLAIDLLSVFEYIPFNEFMSRLNDLLFSIIRNLPKNDKVLVFPYGKFGKSATFVTYPLKNTVAFKKMGNNILITNDLQNLQDKNSYKHIIFIDDFIGSGDTFCNDYKTTNFNHKWISANNLNVYLLCAIIMEDGKRKIENKFSEVKIFAETKYKIFDKIKSPFQSFGNLKDLENISSKYGKMLSLYAPLGFSNSQSFLAFSHGTPDNTLPIIWVQDRNWEPIYPREPKIRMDEAKEFKKEIAFYIGICNRLGIDIISGKSIIDKIKDKYVRKTISNTKSAHSIVALLFLKNLGHDNIIICHILGLTREELRKIYIEAKLKNLLDFNYELNIYGHQFLEELKKKVKKEKIRKDSLENLTKKTNEIYLPYTFKGLT